MTPADPLETEIWANQRRLRLMRLARAGIVLAVLVVLNQACTHTYASVKIAQAKSLGVYPTPEAAAGAMFNRPWEDVPVASLGGVHCDINNPDGDPFVWFCTARVRYEQPPAGYTRTDFLHGSFFFKVEDGWVYMGEHLFIDVISSAMKRFHLEGVE